MKLVETDAFAKLVNKNTIVNFLYKYFSIVSYGSTFHPHFYCKVLYNTIPFQVFAYTGFNESVH